MANRIMGTPYSLDEFLPAIEAIVSRPGWLISKPQLPVANMEERMVVLYQPLTDFTLLG